MKSHICLRSSHYANVVCIILTNIVTILCKYIIIVSLVAKQKIAIPSYFSQRANHWPRGHLQFVDNAYVYYILILLAVLTIHYFTFTKCLCENSEILHYVYFQNEERKSDNDVLRQYIDRSTDQHKNARNYTRALAFLQLILRTRWEDRAKLAMSAFYARTDKKSLTPRDAVTMRTSYHAQVLSATSRAHVRRQRALTSRCVDSANSICDEKFRRVVAAQIFFAKYLCTLCDIIQYLGLCTTF